MGTALFQAHTGSRALGLSNLSDQAEQGPFAGDVLHRETKVAFLSDQDATDFASQRRRRRWLGEEDVTGQGFDGFVHSGIDPMAASMRPTWRWRQTGRDRVGPEPRSDASRMLCAQARGRREVSNQRSGQGAFKRNTTSEGRIEFRPDLERRCRGDFRSTWFALDHPLAPLKISRRCQHGSCDEG